MLTLVPQTEGSQSECGVSSHDTESWIRGKSFRSLQLTAEKLKLHTTDKRADDNLDAILTFSYRCAATCPRHTRLQASPEAYNTQYLNATSFM